VAEPILKEGEFQKFSRYIYERCGIHLHDGKKELLKARLGKILRSRNFSSYREYFDHVVNDTSGYEITILLNSISTNLTYFFRESQHLEFLTGTALPEIAEAAKAKGISKDRPLRLWSAGCSSGEEPYSIAIALNEARNGLKNFQVEILATDISTKVLSAAGKGIYEKKKIEGIPLDLKRKYFQRGVNRWEGYFRVKKEIRGKIRFKRLNLIEEFEFKEPFDVIFCRNVMIYFDAPAREALVKKFYKNLSSPGYLFIGHAESLSGVRHSFKYIQPSIFRKE